MKDKSNNTVSSLNGVEITYSDSANDFRISCLCLPYFAIEGFSQDELINILKISNLEKVNLKQAYEHIFPPDQHYADLETNQQAVKLFISPNLNNWIYLGFDYNLGRPNLIFDLLLPISSQKIAFFYIDPWAAGLTWIIANSGKIMREFTDEGETISTSGTSVSIEEEIFIKNREAELKQDFDGWAKNRTNPFVTMEEVFTAVVKNTVQHIEELNNYNESFNEYIIGTVNIEKIRATT